RTAVLEADPPLKVEIWSEPVREAFIEIRLGEEPGKLVGVIELLSPANKTPGVGRDLYLKKQSHLLRSRSHLIEIDLLRAGQHTVAVRRDGLPESGWDYVVCLHRGEGGSRFECWPFPLQELLPRINV